MIHGGMSENGVHKLIYLIVCPPVGGSVWEGLRDVLLKEMCDWGV